jgi:hypothetical protein
VVCLVLVKDQTLFFTEKIRYMPELNLTARMKFDLCISALGAQKSNGILPFENQAKSAEV